MPVIKYIDPTNTLLASTPINHEDNTTTPRGMLLTKIIKEFHILMLFLFIGLLTNSVLIPLISTIFVVILIILIAAFTVVFILIKYKKKTKGKFSALLLS